VSDHSTASEFFVGWAGGPAPRTRRHLWRALALAAVLAAGVASGAAALQRETRAGVFEFGTTRDFAGWIERHPHPVLVVPRPGSDEHSRYLLTAFGKRGADALFEAHGDAWVEFPGTLVHRDGRVMVEVAGDAVRAAEPPAGLVRPVAVPEDLGRVTLVGEIVDSKCFLGVMKPGSAASHRACAIRCISGGVPPVLLVRDAEGLAHYHLLVAADGSAVNERVLPIVALPVEITGELQRLGDLSILRADPRTYRLVE
jgi:hypothetical protein